MKRSMVALACMAMIVQLCASAAWAENLLTQSGETFTIKAGFPWVTPETNYHYCITTNGTDGTEGVNAGDGLLDGLSPAENLNLNIPTWRNFAAYPQVKITGSIPANGLTLADGASAGSWLTVGLISQKQAERGADWYLSGMFNNSVMAGFQNWGGAYSAFAEDTAGDGSTPVITFDPTKDTTFELTLDTVAKNASLRLDNGSGWSSSVSHTYGLDNWNWGGIYNDDLSNAAFIVQMYGADGSGTSSATFGDITVSGVPEPATLALLVSAGMGLLAFAWRRRS